MTKITIIITLSFTLILTNAVSFEEKEIVLLLNSENFEDFNKGLLLISKNNYKISKDLRQTLYKLLLDERRALWGGLEEYFKENDDEIYYHKNNYDVARIGRDAAISAPALEAARVLSVVVGYEQKTKKTAYRNRKDVLIFKQWYEKNYPNHEPLAKDPIEPSALKVAMPEAKAEMAATPIIATQETVEAMSVNEPALDAKRPWWPIVALVFLCGNVAIIWRIKSNNHK